MPRLLEAMKDAAWLRYSSGRCLATFDPEVSEWGNLSNLNIRFLGVESRGKLGEVKHFSTHRNREQSALFFIRSLLCASKM